MREIIFDTETTGLDSREDRIIEIGAIELVDRFPTGQSLHFFINPQGRAVHPEALAVHGISDDQLVGKPVFGQLADEIMEFFAGARWVAHNAGFDIGFVNAELSRIGHPPIDPAMVIDTLALARRKHPMGPNSLDALCRRYGIDNSHRTKHGALLDSELLAEVYIEMAGGKQASLHLVSDLGSQSSDREHSGLADPLPPRPTPLPSRLTTQERQAHQELVRRLGENSPWNALIGETVE